MASSLQPQLQMLFSSSDYCSNLSTSYLRSILDCAYAFGGTTGLFWGYLADRMGRRRVTLIGLWSMVVCCLSMGFATNLAACAIFQFIAGMFSSAVVCTTLTMIGDLSATAEERARNVAKLPLISLCGSVGPLIQGMVSESLQAYGMVWEKFPTLGSELACGIVLFAIALAASVLLRESLPQHYDMPAEPMDIDCESRLPDTQLRRHEHHTCRARPPGSHLHHPVYAGTLSAGPPFVILPSLTPCRDLRCPPSPSGTQQYTAWRDGHPM